MSAGQLSVMIGAKRLDAVKATADRAGTSAAEIVRCLVDNYLSRAAECLLQEQVKRLENMTKENDDDDGI